MKCITSFFLSLHIIISNAQKMVVWTWCGKGDITGKFNAEKFSDFVDQGPVNLVVMGREVEVVLGVVLVVKEVVYPQEVAL